MYIHNVYYSLPNQTIIVNTRNYNKFIKTSNSADINETYYNSTSGGVIHRDQNQLCFINEHVDEIWIVSDTYNKKWLSMKEKIDIITKLGDSTGILTGLIQSRWNFNILSNPLFTVPSFVLLSYSSFVFIHTTDLWIRDNYINSSQWGKYHTHKNHFDSYDYVEIFNTSDPSRVDIVEIPYTIHGYDRNNAIYIPYEGEPRNLTVSETYTYFQNETV